MSRGDLGLRNQLHFIHAREGTIKHATPGQRTTKTIEKCHGIWVGGSENYTIFVYNKNNSSNYSLVEVTFFFSLHGS